MAAAPRRSASPRAAGLLVYLSLLAPAVAGSPAPTADPLLELMAGEFALQEGQTDEAAGHYAASALQSADPRLLERATRLAVMAGQLDTAHELLSRWAEVEPEARAQPQIALTLALKRGEAKSAETAIDRLLRRPNGWKPVLQALAGESTSLVTRSLVAELARGSRLDDRLDALLALGGLADRLELPHVLDTISQRAVERHPEAPRAWLWQAEVLRKKELPERARRAIDRALALPGVEPELRLAAAGMLAALGDAAAAAEALADGPQDDRSWGGRAAFLARSEDRQGMGRLYAEIQASAPEGQAERLYLLGQIAELLQKPDEAAAWYGQLPAGDRADAAQLRLAVLAEQAGRLDDAVRLLQALQGGNSEDGKLLIDAYLLEAELQLRNDRGERAIDAFNRGLAVFEDDASLLYGRALAFERLDRIDEAESDLRLMLVLDPDNVDALNALGYTLADRTERLAEAHELIRMALQRQPDNPAIIDSMGWVLFRLGRVEEALPHLRRAFELQRDAEVAAHLGEALWVSGQQDEARLVWRLGREIDADNRALRTVLEKYGAGP